MIGEDMLFDTFGDSDVFLNNIRKFNVDLAKIRHIVLSHDDWDHISGLWQVIPERKDITVYICPGFNPEIKERLASLGAKVIEAAKPMEIKENIYSTGGLYGESPDRKICEQSLVIRTAEGLAVICGCAHPGAVNIVKHAKESFHAEVCLLMGGFHLKDNTAETNINIIKALQALGVRKAAPMHCTGTAATEAMRQAFGEGFMLAEEGMEVDL